MGGNGTGFKKSSETHATTKKNASSPNDQTPPYTIAQLYLPCIQMDRDSSDAISVPRTDEWGDRASDMVAWGDAEASSHEGKLPS